METTKRSPLDRLLFATFLKGRTSSREILNEKGEISPEENKKIEEETNEMNYLKRLVRITLSQA